MPMQALEMVPGQHIRIGILTYRQECLVHYGKQIKEDLS